MHLLIKNEIQNNKEREFLKTSLKILNQLANNSSIDQELTKAITLIEAQTLIDQFDQYDKSIVDTINKSFQKKSGY